MTMLYNECNHIERLIFVLYTFEMMHTLVFILIEVQLYCKKAGLAL